MCMHVHSLCVFRLGFIRNSQSKECVSCNYNIHTFFNGFFLFLALFLKLMVWQVSLKLEGMLIFCVDLTCLVSVVTSIASSGTIMCCSIQ